MEPRDDEELPPAAGRPSLSEPHPQQQPSSTTSEAPKQAAFLTAPLQAPDPSLVPILGHREALSHPFPTSESLPSLFMQAPASGVQAQSSGASAAAATLFAHAPRPDSRRRKSKKEGETGIKKRARKPADSPRRPKSAYMFFLAGFREVWKKEHPESKKVADVARAAGEKWRAMSHEEKAVYERLSNESKALYAREMEIYRSNKEQMRPGQLGGPKGEQSAYFYFLRSFREAYKREHPEQQLDARNIAKQAADTWKSMTPQERDTFEKMAEKPEGPASAAGIPQPQGQERRDRERLPADTPDLQVSSPHQEIASIRHPSLESSGVPGIPASSEPFSFWQQVAGDQADSTSPGDDQSMPE